MAVNFRIGNRAPVSGAFFLLLLAMQVQANDCKLPASADTVNVRQVHDGDTLTLTDGRRVRLIGINTPEVPGKEHPGEPLALEARNRLRQLLFMHNNRIRLVIGKERQDRYGRTLGHLWLADGESVNARMLSEGFGWLIAVPPNLGFQDCYKAAEQDARSDASGVWQHAHYQAIHSADLDLRSSGFRRVQGRVTRVNQGGGALWINLEGHFAIRIPETDLAWFPNPPDRSWVGSNIEVRGWLYSTRGELRTTVHHPSALQRTP